MRAPLAWRLRATWSALALSSGCGLQAFLTAAHVTSVDPWYAVVAHLEPLTVAGYYAQLRGSASPVGEPSALDGNPWSSPRVPLRAEDDGSNR